MAKTLAKTAMARLTSTIANRASASSAMLAPEEAITAPQNSHLRTVDTMPRPKGMCPVFGSAFATMARYRSHHAHRMIVDRVKTLGKVYYDKIFGYKSVNVASPVDAATVYRSEGKHPARPPLTAWAYSRTRKGLPLGVTLADGDLWYSYRRAMDHQLMITSNLNKYMPSMNGIAADYIQILLKNQANNPLGYIEDLKHEQFRWSLESTCRFLYDKRIGCLRVDGTAPPKDIVDFANAIDTIFHTSQILAVMTPLTARIFAPITFWKHNKAWYTTFKVGKKCVDEKIAELNKAKAEGRLEEVIAQGGFLLSMLDEERRGGRGGQLNMHQIYINMTELMGAGVDTTATATQWLFHLLAINKDKQERLHAELARNSRAIDGDMITPEFLAKRAPYLKACVKESLRLRPVLVGTSRLLAKDAVINGYSLPKGTAINLLDFAMSTSEDNYPNANSFQPERWLDQNDERITWKAAGDRFASLPFGFGPRMCVGRRFAETQMYILTSRVVRDFEIVDYNGGQLIEPYTKMLMLPAEPVKIRLQKRVKQLE